MTGYRRLACLPSLRFGHSGSRSPLALFLHLAITSWGAYLQASAPHGTYCVLGAWFKKGRVLLESPALVSRIPDEFSFWTLFKNN